MTRKLCCAGIGLLAVMASGACSINKGPGGIGGRATGTGGANGQPAVAGTFATGSAGTFVMGSAGSIGSASAGRSAGGGTAGTAGHAGNAGTAGRAGAGGTAGNTVGSGGAFPSTGGKSGSAGGAAGTGGLGGSGPACGSRGLPPCISGQFCNFPESAMCGVSDAPGRCEPIPQICTQEYLPVCGCDGMTYGNACGARGAGVSVKHTGAC